MHVCVLHMYACLGDGVFVRGALRGRSDWRTTAHIHNGAAPETAVLQHGLHEGDAVVRMLHVGVQLLGGHTLRDTERRTPCMWTVIWIQLSGSDVPRLAEHRTPCMCNMEWIQLCGSDVPRFTQHRTPCVRNAWIQLRGSDNPHVAGHTTPCMCNMGCPLPCTAVNGLVAPMPVLPVPSSPLPIPPSGMLCPLPCTAVNAFCCFTHAHADRALFPLQIPASGVPSSSGHQLCFCVDHLILCPLATAQPRIGPWLSTPALGLRESTTRATTTATARATARATTRATAVATSQIALCLCWTRS